jgi:NADH-quinone oxidoreductase subunit A
MMVFAAAAATVGLFLALTLFIGPKRPNEKKALPFECGFIKPAEATHPYPIKYYLVAILFIVFDIEVAFMYPWAVSFKQIGMTGFVSMMVFLAILLVGLYYAAKKRVFDWK